MLKLSAALLPMYKNSIRVVQADMMLACATTLQLYLDYTTFKILTTCNGLCNHYASLKRSTRVHPQIDNSEACWKCGSLFVTQR